MCVCVRVRGWWVGGGGAGWLDWINGLVNA